MKLCGIIERRHGVSIGEKCAKEYEMMIREAYSMQRTYWTPPTTRNDTGRADRIREVAKRLPTGVTAERFGVSRSYVHRILKK